MALGHPDVVRGRLVVVRNLGCGLSVGTGSLDRQDHNSTEGLNGFDFGRSSQEKRAEDPGLTRKRSLETNRCQFNAH